MQQCAERRCRVSCLYACGSNQRYAAGAAVVVAGICLEMQPVDAAASILPGRAWLPYAVYPGVGL
jgi:hypothetical protein